jgi:hypothetical protein
MSPATIESRVESFLGICGAGFSLWVERDTIVSDGAENPQAEACATKHCNFVERG